MNNTSHQFSRAVSRSFALVAVVAVLVSCTGSPEPTESVTPTPSPSVTSTASASPTPVPTPAPTVVETEPEPLPDEIPVAAVITIAEVNTDGSVTVGGFVNGVSEDDFECTFVLAQGSASTSLPNIGLENNGTTACGSVTFASSQLVSGTATLRLDYAGSQGRVTSEPVEVTIP